MGMKVIFLRGKMIYQGKIIDESVSAKKVIPKFLCVGILLPVRILACPGNRLHIRLLYAELRMECPIRLFL